MVVIFPFYAEVVSVQWGQKMWVDVEVLDSRI